MTCILHARSAFAIKLSCLFEFHTRAPNCSSAGDRWCTRGMLKASAESFAYSSALCGEAQLHTLSNHAGSEGRDPLHSELSCHVCLDLFIGCRHFLKDD